MLPVLPATPSRRGEAPLPSSDRKAWSSPSGSDCFSDDMTVASPEQHFMTPHSFTDSLAFAQPGASPGAPSSAGAPQLLQDPGASAAQRALLHRLAGVVRAVHAAHRLTDHHCDLLAADVERLERTLRAPDPQSKEPADAFVDNDDDDDEEEAGEDLAEEKARRMRDAEKRAEMERVVARVMAVRGDMERRIAGMKEIADDAQRRSTDAKAAISHMRYEKERMAFENESLMADNRRYCAEVTDLAAENSTLLAENGELRTEGDTLLTEVRNLRQVVAVNRTDLLYLKLKLKGLELRMDSEGDDKHLLEDIEEWRRNWRQAKGQRDVVDDTVRSTESGPARLEGIVASNDDAPRSTISLSDGGQLVITRAAGSQPYARSARSSSVSADEASLGEPSDEEEEVEDDYGDYEDYYEEGDGSEQDTDDAADDDTVTQEEAPASEEASKSPWERLWEDLSAFAGVHD